MDKQSYFISCDWGTTNFRLAVVNRETLDIAYEIKTDKGVKAVYNEYLAQNIINQVDFFSDYLTNQLKQLPEAYSQSLLVSSGMVTSNIGLYNMDYAKFPFDGNGSNFKSKKIKLKNNRDLILISGVRNENGMMRGEETQAIGLADFMNNAEEAVLILPGTHSKHLSFKNGVFLDLKSYMTGEIFEILSKKSILSNSIIKSQNKNIIEHSFVEGLKLGIAGQLTASLFSIRAKDLFKKATKNENYFFLSGLLIGDELSYVNHTKHKIYMAAPKPLITLYKLALDFILSSNDYVIFNDEISAKATLYGQHKILKHYE